MLNIILLYTYQGNTFLSLRQGIRGEGQANVLPGNLNGVRLPRGQPQNEHRQQHNFLDNIPENEESENENIDKDSNAEEDKKFLKQLVVKGKSPKNSDSESDHLQTADQDIKVTEMVNDNDSIKQKVTAKTEKFQPTKEEFNFETEPVARNPNGPGENGQAVNINESEKKEESEGYNQHAFNELASRKISLHRSIPDTREPG